MVVFYIGWKRAGENDSVKIDATSLVAENGHSFSSNDLAKGDVVDFSKLRVAFSSATGEQRELAFGEYRLFVNPDVNTFDRDTEVNSPTYTFEMAGIASLRIVYSNEGIEHQDSFTFAVVNTPLDFTVYYIILTVVLLTITGFVVAVRKYRSGTGFLAKKRERDAKLVEDYKKELEAKKKGGEDGERNEGGNASQER